MLHIFLSRQYIICRLHKLTLTDLAQVTLLSVFPIQCQDFLPVHLRCGARNKFFIGTRTLCRRPWQQTRRCSFHGQSHSSGLLTAYLRLCLAQNTLLLNAPSLEKLLVVGQRGDSAITLFPVKYLHGSYEAHQKPEPCKTHPPRHKLIKFNDQLE